QLVQGWQEAMLLMPEGAKWQLFIPSELAYGEAGAPEGKLGPNELLIYDVTLVSIDAPGQTKNKDNGIRTLTAEDMKQTSSWKRPNP
ncbi:MAG: FKBP-type peptidyl-prolyl cis-trans isomerase, partial [Methylophilaceae bacterium]|nr:FKBP-type peptidyl-prolyl cis-trans isomerase [Methylophilaceae bacterium]